MCAPSCRKFLIKIPQVHEGPPGSQAERYESLGATDHGVHLRNLESDYAIRGEILAGDISGLTPAGRPIKIARTRNRRRRYKSRQFSYPSSITDILSFLRKGRSSSDVSRDAHLSATRNRTAHPRDDLGVYLPL